MKTLEEAMACIIEPADKFADPEIKCANLKEIGAEVATCEPCVIYVDGLAHAVFDDEDMEDAEYRNAILSFGMSMLVAGVYVGIEMEKSDDPDTKRSIRSRIAQWWRGK